MKISKNFSVLLCCAAVSLAGTALAQATSQPVTGSDQNTAAPANGASVSRSYHVELNFSNNDIGLKEIDLMDAPAPQRLIQPLNGWRCDVVAPGNVVIDSFLFDIPTITCTDIPGKDAGLTGGCVSKDKSSFSLEVPYHENGIGIVFWRPDGKNYYINTIGFAKLCGDDFCESNENYSTCSKDCRSGVRDGYCDGVADGTCDPDCFALSDHGISEDADCKAVSYSPNASIAWWIVGLLVLVLAVGIFVARKKK